MPAFCPSWAVTNSARDLLEFGCGYALFTEAAARRTSSMVHALEIRPEMIEATRQRISAAGLPNVIIEQRDLLTDGCGVPDQSIGYLRDRLLPNVLSDGRKASVPHRRRDPLVLSRVAALRRLYRGAPYSASPTRGGRPPQRLESGNPSTAAMPAVVASRQVPPSPPPSMKNRARSHAACPTCLPS